MKRLYQILLTVTVTVLVCVILVLAIVLPLNRAHHEPHPPFRIDTAHASPYASTKLLPLPDFQPVGTLFLPQEEYSHFDSHMAFNQEHLVGLTLGWPNSKEWQRRVNIIAIRGIVAEGDLALRPGPIWFDAHQILQVEIYAEPDQHLKAVVISEPQAGSSILEVRLLGWTTSFHWHVYKTWKLDNYYFSPNNHRAAFVTLPHGSALVLAHAHVCDVFSVHDVEQVRKIQTLNIFSLDRKALQLTGASSLLLITVDHEDGHHGFVEYNWDDSAHKFEVGTTTRLEQHESMDYMHLNRSGTSMVSHIQNAYVTPWLAGESWTRTDHRWSRTQNIMPISPTPKHFGLQTSENNELMVVCLPEKIEKCFIYRKQPDSHWYVMGGRDPDFVDVPHVTWSVGMAISISLTHHTATLLVLSLNSALNIFRWTF